MTVEYVIFDWAGTLTPWHPVDLAEIWRETAASVQGVTPERVPILAARLFQAEREVMGRCRTTQCSARIDEVFRQAGLTLEDQAVAAYRRIWEAHTFIDPLALPMLAGLRARGVRVGVLSNTLWPAVWHDEVFARDGVLDYVDGAVYSSEVPWSKPHPEIFLAGMTVLGATSASACAFVGDRVFEDVHGAQAAGMRTILVPHSNLSAEELVHRDATPDAVVETLADVLMVVDKWNAQES